MKKMTKVVTVVLMSMMVTVVFAQTASQKESNKPAVAQISAEESAKYLNYMTTHDAKQMGLTELDYTLFVELFKSNNQPIYTVVEEGGLVAGRKYAANDSLGIYIIREDILKLFSYPIRTNEKEAAAAANQDAALKLAAARAWAVEELNEGRPRSGSEIVAKLSDGTEVTIPTKMSDDYGWSLVAGGTYQAGEKRYAFGGEFGARYTHHLDKNGQWFIGGQVLGSFRKTYLNDNAVDAGDDYISYGTVADGIFGRSFGKHREVRLSLMVGLNWEFYKTNSQPRYYDDGSWDELSSKGNYLSPELKGMVEYHPLNWPIGFYAAAGVRQFVSPWQGPDDNTIRRWDPHFEVGMSFNLFRHWTNNK